MSVRHRKAAAATGDVRRHRSVCGTFAARLQEGARAQPTRTFSAAAARFSAVGAVNGQRFLGIDVLAGCDGARLVPGAPGASSLTTIQSRALPATRLRCRPGIRIPRPRPRVGRYRQRGAFKDEMCAVRRCAELILPQPIMPISPCDRWILCTMG